MTAINGFSGGAMFASFGFVSMNQSAHTAINQNLGQVQNFFTNINSFNMGTLPQMPQTGFAQQSGFMTGGYIAPPNMGTIQPNTPQNGKSGLIQTGKTPPEYVTPGGYKIAAEGKDAAWTVTTPEGKKTRIWGDPHVHESDGGKWDFKKNMSFVLPDGTKISVKTTPPRPNGYTVSESIDIMNGNQRATIGGIDKNKPTSEGVQNDRWALDARTPDGDYAVLGGDGDDWFLQGKNEIVGSEKQGEVFKTKAGTTRGITHQAQQAMSEGRPMPRFGGQQFLMQMIQQMMQQIQAQLGQIRY